MRLLGRHSRHMKKAGKEGFIHDGFELNPRFKGQQMVNITNRNHYHIKLFHRDMRNKYYSSVWHNKGNTGAGCRTSRIRFNY